MILKKIIISHWQIILLILISAILRFWRLGELTTFGGDQGVDFQNIKSIAEGNLTLLGPRIGPYNDISTLYLGPLYYYLLLPFLFFAKFDPIGASFSIIIARITTTVLIYLAAKNFFNKKAALYASLISVVSPYWVDHLGPPSSPYFILPLVALILFLISKNTKNHKLFLIIGFLAGLAIHLHYLAMVLIPATFSYFLIRRDKFAIRKTILFFAGLFVSISPIFLFEIRHKFFLTNQILKQLSGGLLTVGKVNLYSNFKVLADFISYYLLGLDKIGLFFLAMIILLVIYSITRVPGKVKSDSIFLLLFILINLIGASVYFGKPQPHYLASAFVPLFVIAGLLLYEIEKLSKLLFLILIIFISISLLRDNHLLSNQGYTMPEDLTLKEIRKISKIIADDVSNDSFNIASTLDGDSRARPYRYLVDVYGKTPQSVENYDKPDSLYVITRDPARSIRDNNLFEIASFQPSNVTRDWSIVGDIHLIKLSKKQPPQELPQKFITIVNPVRSRQLWNEDSIKYLEEQVQSIKRRDLRATWLLQYDTLVDQEIIDLLKKQDASQELGAFLEVSEKWATDSRVSYKYADGDYYRPDKVFLSGYAPEDRKKLIKTYFKNFYMIFGNYPKSVGAWYIDANSQNYLSEFGVTSALTVADQFDTDAASVWGKYFSFPFYPSKYNSLEPANNQSNKIPIVNIQWAQREPILGYGREVKDSRHSFQANDYTSNGYDFSYFDNLLSLYFNNNKTDFVQVTIGLEAGQEAIRFKDEFERQLDELQSLANQKVIQNTTMADFALWYQNKYPGISPSHFLTKDESFWYMSPKFRVAIFKEGEDYVLKDLRYYTNIPFRDYLYVDENKYLDRKVSATVDNLMFANQINLGKVGKLDIVEKFDRLILKLDNRQIEVSTQGVMSESRYLVKISQDKNVIWKNLRYLTVYHKVVSPPKDLLAHFKYSKINGQTVLGITVSNSKLIGVRGRLPGIFGYEFQTFSKFLTPAQIFDKWQPWIN